MPKNDSRASETVKTSEGRLYHIDAGPGELAPYILMCLDQVRAKRVAGLFDEVTVERSCREILTCTGSYQGIPISVIGTGIGPDNTEIIFVEAVQLFPEARPTMIRVGSSGGLKAGVAIGDLVISTGSVRLENTSTGFVDPGYPAVAHHEVTLALIAAADQLGAPYHVGLTASASGFFGAQGRSVAGMPSRDPELPQRLASWNVLNMEMEASALFTLGNLAGVRIGAVCNIYSNRVRGEFIGDDVRVAADEAAELDARKTRRGRNKTTFTAVGYGLQRIYPVFVEADRVRMAAYPRLIQINTPGFTGDFSLLLSNNHSTGGTCFGDSGGPNFLGDSNVVAGVTSFGLNGNCAGTGGVFRMDRQNVLDFVNSHMD